ncbi:MAG: hypothetical protein R3C28_26170 [Pirellulaceae bacterium]
MYWVAWRVLTGDKVKYIAMIVGVTFSLLLISQHASIFCGLMRLTVSQILDVQGANIWVMDRDVRFVDDIKPMAENEVYRIRGVEGAQWAVRLYKGLTRVRLQDGH